MTSVLTIAIPLRYILLDPDRVDGLLRGLPDEEAVRPIKESYGFLSAAVEVHLEDDVAIITLEEPGAP